MIPVLRAERTMDMVDALSLMSEYVKEPDRQKLSTRLVALLRGKVPPRLGGTADTGSGPDYPGQQLKGGAQTRWWFRNVGGFKRKGMIQE